MDNGQKNTLVTMANSLGWALALSIGDTVIKEMERTAIDCDDDSKILGLARDARAAKKFWDAFKANVETAKQPEESAEDQFIPVSY